MRFAKYWPSGTADEESLPPNTKWTSVEYDKTASAESILSFRNKVALARLWLVTALEQILLPYAWSIDICAVFTL
jgi:hypothetical protein